MKKFSPVLLIFLLLLISAFLLKSFIFTKTLIAPTRVISLISPSNPPPATQAKPRLPTTSTVGLVAKASRAGQSTTSLIAVGDIMLGRFVNVKILESKDWRYPFLKIVSLTSSADITFGNLESPLVKDCPTTSTGMIFCGRPEAVEGLIYAGFDILSIANNHILNYGLDGKQQTINLLNQNEAPRPDGRGIFSSLLRRERHRQSGIPPWRENPTEAENSSRSFPILRSGFSAKEDKIIPSSNNLVIKQVNNLKFGFLSYDLVTYPLPRPSSLKADETGLIPLISQISPTVDILIISLHWGAEYQKNPSKQQTELAHQIIDAGAKIIIGHHPHVTQPTESYHNGLIFYSLGNFVFDQSWSEETKKGKIAKIIFEGKKIKSFEEIPIYIENGQPKLAQ